MFNQINLSLSNRTGKHIILLSAVLFCLLPGCDSSEEIPAEKQLVEKHEVETKLIKGQWFFVTDEKSVAALQYDNGPDYFQEGLARFVQDRRIGFVNESLEVVVEPDWDFAFPFENGVATVCMGCREVSDGEHKTLKGGRWGYIDKAGVIIVQPRYKRHALPPPPTNMPQPESDQ